MFALDLRHIFFTAVLSNENDKMQEQKMKKLFSIFISLIIIALPVFSAFAMTSGFDTEELSKQESEKIISNIAFKRLDSAPEKCR